MRWLRFMPMALAAMLAAPGTGRAFEQTCTGCAYECCQWAHAANFTSRSRLVWEDWERLGYQAVPCQDFAPHSEEQHRCQWKAYEDCVYDRCGKCDVRLRFAILPNPFSSTIRYQDWERRSPSGAEPVHLYPGQETVIGKDGDKEVRHE